MFKLVLHTNSDAFRPDIGFEIERILRAVADRFDWGEEDAFHHLTDFNGNTVGFIRYEPNADEEL